MKLKPCPFCGGKAKIAFMNCGVYCSNDECFAHTKTIDYWNRRVKK